MKIGRCLNQCDMLADLVRSSLIDVLDVRQGLHGAHDLDVLVSLQVEEVFVARDNEIGVGGERAGKHLVIVRIGADHWGNVRRSDELAEKLITLNNDVGC